jgi:mannose-6-phosphate isomerase
MISDKSNPESAETPWGKWEVLLSEPGYKVKRITVRPGQRLSYQKHAWRQEHWVAVAGRGIVVLDGEEIILESGAAVDIPAESAHRAVNPGTEPFVFIEVQRGSYLGEDDIIRLEDSYGRA